MTTVLKLKVGNRTRTCSSRCHKAKGKVCCCICEGTYHGKQSQLNTAIADHQNSLVDKLKNLGELTAILLLLEK